jgi:outer membrane protein
MIRSLLTLTFALTLAGAAAPEPPLLTLEEAVALAIESNPALAAESAAARTAAAAVREGRAARWPRLLASAGAGRTTDPVAVFGGLLRQERFAPRYFDPVFLNEPDPLTSYRASVSIEQALWAGGRIASRVEGAERAAESAVHILERARQELAFRVLDRYTAAVVARQAVAVRRGSLEAARESVRMAGDRFETGLVVESDVLQARLRQSEAEAVLAEAERDAAVAAASLNLELGRELDSPIALPDRLPEAIEAPELDGAANEVATEEVTLETEAALDRRPDLLAARAWVDAARAALGAARAGRLPEVGWGGSYAAETEEPSDSPGSHWSIGLGLTWTGFDGFATAARVEGAQARLEQAERLADHNRRAAELEVEAARRGLATARLRWRQAREAVALAERSAVIVQDRYREGMTTILELLEVESLLAGSRSRELQARRGVVMALGELDLALGRL